MSARKKYATTADYLADAPAVQRRMLRDIRAMVKREVPGAVETISYNIPAFRMEQVFFYYAAFKDHISVFPPLRARGELAKKLKPFCNPKGNLLLSIDKPLPMGLLAKVATGLAAQSGGRSKPKKPRKSIRSRGARAT